MEHTLALIEKAHEGDKAARDTLAEENMGLVWSMVRRFANRGGEMEDLCQIGSIGLLKAIDKFDPSFEVCFSTYAVPMIAGEIRRFLRSEGLRGFPPPCQAPLAGCAAATPATAVSCRTGRAT